MNEKYTLHRGTDLLGTVVLKDELCDFPWYGGEFKAAPAFETVKHLFREELLLLDRDDMEAWEAVWTQIEKPGLSLLPADGGAAETDLLIHIEDEKARWRC